MARKIADRGRAGCWARPLRVTVRVVVPILFIGLLWYLHSSVVTIAYVPSGSMEPTLLIKDRILIRLDAYNSHGPERGDIIVYVGSDGAHYVKRVIGIAGETLTVASGRVWINGQSLDEP